MTLLNIFGKSQQSEKDYLVRDICSGEKLRYGEFHTHIERTVRDGKIANELKKRVIKKGFSYKQYMEYALYDQKFGYYTNNPGIGSDFLTKPIKFSPHYGRWLCEVIFKLWKSLVKKEALDILDEFHIIEFGGGTGILAKDILDYACEKSIRHAIYWRFFYKKLKYLIFDISPNLVNTQNNFFNDFGSRVEVKLGDAREKQHIENLKGIIISNELIDAFAMHKIKKQQSKIKAAILYPCIPENSKLVPKELLKEAALNDKLIRSQFHLQDGLQALSKKTYKILREQNERENFDRQVTWTEMWVATKYFPEISQYIANHSTYMRNLPENIAVPLNTDIRKFQEQSSSLITIGYKITIDYQLDYIAFLQKKNLSFRHYPGGFIQSYKFPPGTKDITADINATCLAMEGLRAGWEPIFFGEELHLLGMSPKRVSENLQNVPMDFHVLIEKRGNFPSASETPMISLPITYNDFSKKNVDILSNSQAIKYSPYHRYLLANNIYATHLVSKKRFGIALKKDLHKIYNTVSTLDEKTRKAIKLVFTHLNILKLATQYSSLAEFNFQHLVHCFESSKTDKEIEILAYLLFEQLLQIYYYKRAISD